jgi:hypothetical protein
MLDLLLRSEIVIDGIAVWKIADGVKRAAGQHCTRRVCLCQLLFLPFVTMFFMMFLKYRSYAILLWSSASALKVVGANR